MFDQGETPTSISGPTIRPTSVTVNGVRRKSFEQTVRVDDTGPKELRYIDRAKLLLWAEASVVALKFCDTVTSGPVALRQVRRSVPRSSLTTVNPFASATPVGVECRSTSAAPPAARSAPS